MKVLNSQFEIEMGYPVLVLETELGRMRIGREQKLWKRYGLLFVGAAWEDKLPEIALPAEPADNQGELKLRGFTRDKEVVEAFEEFLAWWAEGGEEGGRT